VAVKGADRGENLYHFVINNPLFYYDWLGREFVPVGDKEFKEKAEKALKETEENLNKAKDKAKEEKEKEDADKAIKCFNACKECKKKIIIKETKAGNSYSFKADTINWNPDKKTGGVNEKGSSERPPSIGLGHEISHAHDDVVESKTDIKSKSLDSKKYSNKTEERAVEFENQIRKGAGEPVRSKY
jgi:hypothetical protein